MNASGVEQLAPLSDLFARVIAHTAPASVAILGVAGGNGLSRIDPKITTRIVGVDIHQGYLDAVASRFAGLPGLELHCADLASIRVSCAPVDLVHVALVFEHAGTELCLENAVAMVVPGGCLSVVLQLPSEIHQAVSPTNFASLQALQEGFQLIEPSWLMETMAARFLRLESELRLPLPSGKGLWHGLFRREQ